VVKGGYSSVFSKYGHVLCQIIENVGQESQIRDHIMSGSGHDRLGGHY